MPRRALLALALLLLVAPSGVARAGDPRPLVFAHRGASGDAPGNSQVNTWTVNAPSRVGTLARLGVSGIITDFPAMARRVLARRDRVRPPPHRAARAMRRANKGVKR